MNKRQQLEKLGNELNETFKQYVELATQVEIENQIENLINKLEKIFNGEEIVEGLTENHKPEPTIIDMLMRYKNLLDEVETSDDEVDEECEDDEDEVDEVDEKEIAEKEFKEIAEKEFMEFFEKEFQDFLQLLKR